MRVNQPVLSAFLAVKDFELKTRNWIKEKSLELFIVA